MVRTGVSPYVIRTVHEMMEQAEAWRRAGFTIAVVPTMGYLHEGHQSLLREARRRADRVVLTLFVNPTQFGPNEDLSRYPRDEAGDLQKAAACGTDVAFCPTPDEMYPSGAETAVSVVSLAQPLCGEKRPGHFAGVATIVSKLFIVTKPHLAFFGQKDFQQLAVIRRMARDLLFDVQIIGMPIVREGDGLAMSSRNVYLSEAERQVALGLVRGLGAAEALWQAGERTASALVAAASTHLTAPSMRLDYVEVRDADSLGAVDVATRSVVLAMAVFVGKTRLIDNRVFTP